MRASRTLAAVSLAIILGTGLQGMGLTRAHPARDLSSARAIYAGLASGDIYRSDDGGATWQAATNGLPGGSAITGLAVASDGSVVYAATDGAGLYASTDGGQSWQDDNGSPDAGIPADASLVGVAVYPEDSQHLVAISTNGDFYVSTDGGQTWSSQEAAQLYDNTTTTLAVADLQPATIFVGTSGGGLLISTDDGNTWNQASDIPSWATVKSLALDPRDADKAYAATDSGLYLTTDGGQSWQMAYDLPQDGSIQAAIVEPQDDAVVLAGAGDGTIYRSTDGGTSWQNVYSALTGPRIFVADPGRRGAILAAGDAGSLLTSTDSGHSWYVDSSLPFDPSQVRALAAGTPLPLPSDPVDPPSDLNHVRYFANTHHTLRDPFLTFWDRHGNGPLFGSPITEAFTEDGQTVQYFERARLVISDGRVVVSPLGTIFTSGRYFPQTRPFTSTTSRLYFPSTGHSLYGIFLAYWRAHQGSLVMGPPISEPLREQNGDGTGRYYLVQYFQNMRLEYHPELAHTPYVVSPGLIGRQYLHQRGWI